MHPVPVSQLSLLLVMTLKRQRRANAALPENSATPMFRTSCETEMHIWKYGWKWIALCKSSYFT